MRLTSIFVILLLLVLMPVQQQTAADIVFKNGNVYTVDTKQPRAQAIAVTKDRIVFVGSNADAQHPEEKPAMKRIARAGRVLASAGGVKRRRFDELSIAVNDGARRSERHAGDRASVTCLQLNERCTSIRNSSHAMRKLFRTNHDVDKRQQVGKPGIDVVNIGGDDRA